MFLQQAPGVCKTCELIMLALQSGDLLFTLEDFFNENDNRNHQAV